MTNDVRKGTGNIGVRLSDNSEFGPTAETFEGTNIVGIIMEPDKLNNIGEKGVVYIREVRA